MICEGCIFSRSSDLDFVVFLSNLPRVRLRHEPPGQQVLHHRSFVMFRLLHDHRGQTYYKKSLYEISVLVQFILTESYTKNSFCKEICQSGLLAKNRHIIGSNIANQFFWWNSFCKITQMITKYIVSRKSFEKTNRPGLH